MFSRFGTSSDMVIQPLEEQGDSHLLAIDAKGLYFTTRNRVDTGLADPNRYAANRADVTSRLQALGLSVEALVSANKHRIQTAADAPVHKVNPLKASKRKGRG